MSGEWRRHKLHPRRDAPQRAGVQNVHADAGIEQDHPFQIGLYGLIQIVQSRVIAF